MVYVVIELVVQAAVTAFGWVLRVAASVAVEATQTAAVEAVAGRKRRRMRRHFRQLAAGGRIDDLVREYRRLGGGDDVRDYRIDALSELARHDAAAAEPLVREILEGASSDTWLVMAALHTAAKYRMVDLSEAVGEAQQDSRARVAGMASSVGRRLERTRRVSAAVS